MIAPDRPLVRLRGLPFSAKDDDVRQFLGSDISVGFIYFTSTSDGRPSGEAFVQLNDADEVTKAQDKHQQNMGSRYIEVFPVNDSERDQIVRRIQEKANRAECGSIRARGLPFSCKREDLEDFFQGMTVTEVVFGKEPGEWGRPTGEAYIRFASKDDAERAVQLDGKYLGKRYVELFRVDFDAFEQFRAKMDRNHQRPRPLAQIEDPWGPPGRGGGGGGGYYGSHHGGGGGYDRGGPPPYEYNTYDRNTINAPVYDPYAYPRNQAGGGGPPSGGGGYGRGPASGYAAHYDNPDPYAPPPPYRGGGGGGGPRQSQGYGRQHYSSGEIITPCKVHMRGLPYRIAAQQILEFFQPANPVEIKVGVFDDGRASGDGIVEFETERDALNALKKDKQAIRNRYIELFPHDQMKIPPATTYKSIYKGQTGYGGGGGGGYNETWRY